MRRAALTWLVVATTVPAMAMAAVERKPVQRVRITASAAEPSVVLGSSVAISGQVSPQISKLPLLLQQRTGQKWLITARQRTKTDGSFSFNARPRRHGQSYWRVVTAPSTQQRATGTSPPLSIFAVQWSYLAKFQVVQSDDASSTGEWSTQPAGTNGIDYGHAIVMDPGCQNGDGGDFWIDYDLARHYTRLQTTVGIRDDAETTASASFQLIADGTVLTSGNLRLGMSVPIDVSVTGVLRLRLFISEADAPNDDCGFQEPASIVWGNPQVLG